MLELSPFYEGTGRRKELTYFCCRVQIVTVLFSIWACEHKSRSSHLLLLLIWLVLCCCDVSLCKICTYLNLNEDDDSHNHLHVGCSLKLATIFM